MMMSQKLRLDLTPSPRSAAQVTPPSSFGATPRPAGVDRCPASRRTDEVTISPVNSAVRITLGSIPNADRLAATAAGRAGPDVPARGGTRTVSPGSARNQARSVRAPLGFARTDHPHAATGRSFRDTL